MNNTCARLQSPRGINRVFAAFAADRNYRCNYGNRFAAMQSFAVRTGERERGCEARCGTKFCSRERYKRIPTTSIYIASLGVRGSIVLGIRETYENTLVVTTAAHNRVSVSDCSRTIVRPRQFLMITYVHLESVMMPLAWKS